MKSSEAEMKEAGRKLVGKMKRQDTFDRFNDWMDRHLGKMIAVAVIAMLTLCGCIITILYGQEIKHFFTVKNQEVEFRAQLTEKENQLIAANQEAQAVREKLAVVETELQNRPETAEFEALNTELAAWRAAGENIQGYESGQVSAEEIVHSLSEEVLALGETASKAVPLKEKLPLVAEEVQRLKEELKRAQVRASNAEADLSQHDSKIYELQAKIKSLEETLAETERLVAQEAVRVKEVRENPLSFLEGLQFNIEKEEDEDDPLSFLEGLQFNIE